MIGVGALVRYRKDGLIGQRLQRIGKGLVLDVDGKRLKVLWESGVVEAAHILFVELVP